MKLKNKIIKKIFSITILVIQLFFVFQTANADSLKSRLDNLGGNSKISTQITSDKSLSTTKLPVLISNIVKIVLGLMGTVALIFIIKAGIDWMLAKGDSTKIKEIRKVMAAALVGLMIVAVSYSLVDFVMSQIIYLTNKAS